MHLSPLTDNYPFFISRNNLFDASKPKVLSEDAHKISSSEGDVTESIQLLNSKQLPENTDQGISVGDDSIHASNENANLAIEQPQTLKYDFGSPSYDPALAGEETNSILELPVGSASDVVYAEACRKDSTEVEEHLQGMYQLESKTDDWECFIPDAADLLIFNSPNRTEAFKGLMQKSLDPTVRYFNSLSQLPRTNINNGRKLHDVDPVASGSEHIQPGGSTTDLSQENLVNADVMASNPSEKNDNEVGK